MNKPVKSTSLKELGFTIKPEKGKDSQGNEFVFRVEGPKPVFFIKRTKRGRLVALKDKKSSSESTIDGLYDFRQYNDDLVGRRAGGELGEVRIMPSSEKEQATHAA